jgi:hypothetical protein
LCFGELALELHKLLGRGYAHPLLLAAINPRELAHDSAFFFIKLINRFFPTFATMIAIAAGYTSNVLPSDLMETRLPFMLKEFKKIDRIATEMSTKITAKIIALIILPEYHLNYKSDVSPKSCKDFVFKIMSTMPQPNVNERDYAFYLRLQTEIASELYDYATSFAAQLPNQVPERTHPFR